MRSVRFPSGNLRGVPDGRPVRFVVRVLGDGRRHVVGLVTGRRAPATTLPNLIGSVPRAPCSFPISFSTCSRERSDRVVQEMRRPPI